MITKNKNMKIKFRETRLSKSNKERLEVINEGNYILNQPNMEKLKAVEVCEIGQIKVNGVIGQNLIDAAKECIYLANLLKVTVQLYWNGKYIDVYTGTTIKEIIEKSTLGLINI